jgi:phosphate transport system substrate-binding protein
MTVAALCGALSFGVVACGDDEEEPAGGGGGGGSAETTGGGEEQRDFSNLSGSIRIDGSSTVQPFAQAAAELFNEQASGVRITVGGAGTGDGFERFCRGETQISNASRAIEDDEREACQEGDVEPIELQVSNDALAIVVNPNLEIPNDCLTVQQLRRLLRPNSNITNWSQLGEGFPDQAVTFFTPGEESGTFDYFTEAVLETDAEQRTEDVQTSANDNQLVQGVEGTQGALGYFGFSFANENRERLKILQVDGGDGCVAPSVETAQDGTYKPLSRPLFMYPSAQSIQQEQVAGFLEFVEQNYQRIAEASDFVPMTEEQAQASFRALEEAEAGGAGGGATETTATTE